MIKNLIFDLGGVIVPLNRIACLRAFDEIVGYKDFGEVLNSYRQIGFFEKFENGEISAKKFRQIIRINASPIKDGQKRVIKDREIDYSLNRFLQLLFGVHNQTYQFRVLLLQKYNQGFQHPLNI